jgi:hypothetical protein
MADDFEEWVDIVSALAGYYGENDTAEEIEQSLRQTEPA